MDVMIVEINDTKTLSAIATEFSAYYPFLKIEFYDEPHRWQQESARKHLLPYDKTIGEIRKKHNPGAMEIHSWNKTGVVEQKFAKGFGLNVQIFRLQGDVWVQTVGTDEITLEEQNEIGRKTTVDLLHVADSKTEKDNLY
jgi:hypothetical protein